MKPSTQARLTAGNLLFWIGVLVVWRLWDHLR
jgi:hypothetical protein